ncbi:nectin-4-like [Limanda limanda]|uniref:nectin-4-like n=1 Tax=Limanda limanda TaxID=27771 RepID=UPI0029C8544B|nr:nectin-4-like [Limanda limanda]
MQCVRSLALLLLLVVKVHGDFVEPPQSHTSMRSLAESQTRLPCRYQPVEGEKVVQVTWYKELADGSKDQIITAHFSEGHTGFGRYSGRVKFESSSPTENSALLIPSTEESDEGIYICHISTSTHRHFERHITVTVLILPISTLDPVILKEGDSYRLAATCRAVGRPPPRLSWDSDLPGHSKKDIRQGGSVYSYFFLHPLRSMNGKKLDCLVWHPGLNGSHRISNLLEVQYPPDATITSVSGDWFVGLENAELVCDSGGNPKPQDFTWTRRGGALPDGVSLVGGKLIFGRTLRLNDSGVYECVAKNIAGVGKAEYSVTIAEFSQSKGFTNDQNLLLIVPGSLAAAAVVLVLIIAVLYHPHRNRKLERQLNKKTSRIPVNVNVIVQVKNSKRKQ